MVTNSSPVASRAVGIGKDAKDSLLDRLLVIESELAKFHSIFLAIVVLLAWSVA